MKVESLKDVRDAVADIAEQAGDAEAAHSAEDALYEAVLNAIAHGAHDDFASELAREALRTRDIKFERWCA